GTHPAQGATHASDSISKSSQHVVSHEHYSSILGFIPSPIDVCSLLTGAGLTGMLLQSYLPISTLWVVALFGGLAFNYGIVKPIFGLLLRFASKPTEGL